jgi:hypothetical protein
MLSDQRVYTNRPALDQAREFIRASKAANTLRGYESDCRESWEKAAGNFAFTEGRAVSCT